MERATVVKFAVPCRPRLVLICVAACASIAAPARAQAPARIVESTYFPIKVGSAATFRFNNQYEHEYRCARIEVVGGRECGRFESYNSRGKLIAVEYIHVAADGVYMAAFNANRFDPPMLLLPLPPRDGQSFEVRSKHIGETIVGPFTVGSEKLVSPAGIFMASFAKSMQLATVNSNGKTTSKQSTCKWFAPKVGLVRQSLGVGEKLLADGILIKFRPGIDAPRVQRKESDEIALPKGDYYPLKPGAVATFHQPWDIKEIRCVRMEKFGHRECCRFESFVEGKLRSVEHIFATADGVFRAAHDGAAVEPPQLLLKLPVNVGDRWHIKSTIKGDLVEGDYAVTAERVATAQGTYNAAVVRTNDLTIASKGKREKFAAAFWYVAGIGLVKQELTRGPQAVAYELTKYQSGR